MCLRGRLITSGGTSLLLSSIESKKAPEVSLRHLTKGQITGLQSIPDNTANRYTYQSWVSKL